MYSFFRCSRIKWMLAKVLNLELKIQHILMLKMPKKKSILRFLGCNMVELICICQNISKWESYSYYLSPKLLLSYSNMLFWLRVKSNFLHTLNPLVRMHYREWLRYSSILKARKRSGLWKVKCYILVVLWMPLISNFDDKRSKKD